SARAPAARQSAIAALQRPFRRSGQTRTQTVPAPRPVSSGGLHRNRHRPPGDPRVGLAAGLPPPPRHTRREPMSSRRLRGPKPAVPTSKKEPVGGASLRLVSPRDRAARTEFLRLLARVLAHRTRVGVDDLAGLDSLETVTL